MNSLVKLTVDDDGYAINEDEQKWCLVSPSPCEFGTSILCTGDMLDTEVNSKWVSKEVVKGGITCPDCIRVVKAFKAVKL